MSSGQAQAWPGPGLSKAIFGVWPKIIWPRPGPVFGLENWRGPLAQIVAHGPNFSKYFLRILKNFTSYAFKLIINLNFSLKVVKYMISS